MSDTEPRDAATSEDRPHGDSPVTADHADGGPGSHTEDETGGVTNDPASGGVPEAADDGEQE